LRFPQKSKKQKKKKNTTHPYYLFWFEAS